MTKGEKIMSEKTIEMNTINELQKVSFLNKGLANLSKLFTSHRDELDEVEADAISYFLANAQNRLADSMKEITDTLA